MLTATRAKAEFVQTSARQDLWMFARCIGTMLVRCSCSSLSCSLVQQLVRHAVEGYNLLVMKMYTSIVTNKLTHKQSIKILKNRSEHNHGDSVGCVCTGMEALYSILRIEKRTKSYQTKLYLLLCNLVIVSWMPQPARDE